MINPDNIGRLTDSELSALQDIVDGGRSLQAIAGLRRAILEIRRLWKAGTRDASFVVDAACMWRDHDPVGKLGAAHEDSRSPSCCLALMVDRFRNNGAKP